MGRVRWFLLWPPCCHPQNAGATWPWQGTAAGTQHLAELRGGISEVCVGSHGYLGGCGEGWLGFEIHWFMEEPAREGQGAACLIIVIVLITRAGSEQDPTLRQVPHHPLPGILATIPSCPHHSTRAARQAWAVLCSKGGSQPASPSLSHIQGHTWGHPERAARDTTTFERHSSAPRWEGRAGIPVIARGVTRVPDCCPSLRMLLCRSRQGGVCGIWPRGAGSAWPSDAMESSKQERALPLLAALPALGLDAADKGP